MTTEEGNCPLCGHPYEEHDFDIHNADLGEWFAPGVKAGDPVFPYELMCYGCMEDFNPSPSPGSATHDLFAVKMGESMGHYCHIGPLPRYVQTKPNHWEPTYEPAGLPRIETGSSSANTIVNLQVTI